jgi:uncharacterized membrane protein
MDTVDERTFGEKVSDAVVKFGGSWNFIFTGVGAILVWILLNFLPIAWDKYPFILLNLLLSLIAAFQAPFIMMSQRRCEIKQDLIYRSLFRELKELVETDLSLENELIKQNESLAAEITELKKMVKLLQSPEENKGGTE